jgi:hypothetical protein
MILGSLTAICANSEKTRISQIIEICRKARLENYISTRTLLLSTDVRLAKIWLQTKSCAFQRLSVETRRAYRQSHGR